MSSGQQKQPLLNFSEVVNILISTEFSEFKSTYNDHIQRYDENENETVEDNLKHIKETCENIHSNLDAFKLSRPINEQSKLESQVQACIDYAFHLKFISIEGKTAAYILDYENFFNSLIRIIRAFDSCKKMLPETFRKIKVIISFSLIFKLYRICKCGVH